MGAYISRFFYFLTKLLRFVQFCLGATTVGVRLIAMNDKNEVALVKHTYIPGWHFPGGGVKRRETMRDAAIREAHEEAGIVVQSAPELVGVYFHVVHRVDDHVALYATKDFSLEKSNCPEIAAVKWFDVTALPADISKPTARHLAGYLEKKTISDRW